MSTLTDVRKGLDRTWHNITEGWQHLRERASHAMTRFTPLPHKDNLETRDEHFMRLSSRWGLLASDVEESNDSVTIRLEAPGMEAEDFDLSVIENYLVVRGVKHSQREQHQGNYHIMECAYGRFERAVPLPTEVEENQARARYKRGVLSVTLPKSSRAQHRRIEVQTG